MDGVWHTPSSTTNSRIKPDESKRCIAKLQAFISALAMSEKDVQAQSWLEILIRDML